MIIYEATKKEFLEQAFNDTIADKIYEVYQKKIGKTTQQEILSWKNSMQYMYKVLSDSSIPDNSGIAIEFRIPLTSNRIDFIISGFNQEGNGSIIIIELKQWSEAYKVVDKDGILKTYFRGALVETTHPSYQAWSYFKLIGDFNESVQQEKIYLYPCAYLHNLKKDFEKEVSDESYSKYTKSAPIHFEGDALRLREFIEKYVKKGDDKENLYEINSGKIRPSKSLQDSLVNMLKGNEEFIMIDSQKVVYENALSLGLKTNSDEKKRVMIVEGGPGTGKSVLAINLLVEFIKKGLVSQYVSKNAAPRNVYSSKLKKSHKTIEINHLFRGSGFYFNSKKNEFSVLIVDEAHRLNKKSGLFKNLGENQIKELINASKFTIFFIDENQRIELKDIGTKKEIEKFAKQDGCEIYNYELTSQFRCNGSDGYLAWLDDVLQIHKTANYDGFEMDYDFKIFDDPNELRREIEEKNKANNKARIVAGYCWDWISEGKNNSKVYDININEDFHISWNLGNSSTWAIDTESVNEAGCIHTCQGLEFDYVGVIIGQDMIYDGKKIVTDYKERARTDQSLRGINILAKENPEKARKIADEIIKNTYKTLMTRGQKGCYIYCTDRKLIKYLKERLYRFRK